MKADQQTTIEMDGRSFTIDKFTPDVGCFWGFRMFGSFTNMFSATSENAKKQIDDFCNRITLDMDEFKKWQKDCLHVVKVNVPDSGWHRLMTADGFMSVELSSVTVLQLTIAAFFFSMQDFFESPQQEASQPQPPMGEMFHPTGQTNSSGSP